jgi:hypothetical protein
MALTNPSWTTSANGGVDAVEQAIQVLNDLPPASNMVVTNYQMQAVRYNYLAQSQGFGDLKSSTFAILLEQMGLTAPIRYCYALRSWEPGLAQGALGIYGVFSQGRVADYPWITNCVICRNYNPQSQLPSPRVNSILFTWIVRTMDPLWLEPQVETVAPPGQNYSVCDVSRYTGPGVYISRLTQEDVGGLLYLYSRTNVNVESLDDSVGQADGNDCKRVAPRPGVEKITFVRHPTNSTGGFVAWTNQFADAYFADGLLATQQVQRVVTQPDFLFSAEDFGFGVVYGTNGPTEIYSIFWFHRTGTSSWVNNRVLNGNPDGDGPGVIRPSAKISFAKPGRYVAAAGGRTSGTSHWFWQWASFTTGTNIVIFPGNETNLTSLTLSTRLVSTNGANELEWTLFGREGANYRIEASADLAHWTTNSVLTNPEESQTSSFGAVQGLGRGWKAGKRAPFSK